MDGNEGSLGFGDLAASLVSLRVGGTFGTETALAELPASRRRTGMLAVVLNDATSECSLWLFDENAPEGIAPEAGTGAWRPVRTPAMLYGRSLSFAAGGLADVDAYVDGVATDTSPAVLSGEDLDGTLVTDDIGQPPKAGIAFWPSVTSSSAAGAFTALSEIVFTGTYNGATVARTAVLTDGDGNETIIADGPLETLVSIAIEAQADTDGTFDFGFSGVGPKLDAVGSPKRWELVSNAAAAAADTATAHVIYQDGTEDTVLLAKGAALKAAPVRVFADTAPAITIYE